VALIDRVEPLADWVAEPAEAEYRVDLVVGEGTVRGGHRAQNIAIKTDLIERDGVLEPVVKVVPHGSTSVARQILVLTGARLRVSTVVPHDPSGSFLVILTGEPDGPECDLRLGRPARCALAP
jgi:hypothetical protein